MIYISKTLFHTAHLGIQYQRESSLKASCEQFLENPRCSKNFITISQIALDGLHICIYFLFVFCDFGPSGVRALPLAAGRNVGGHYFRYCQNPNSTISSIQQSLRLDYILTQRSTTTTTHHTKSTCILKTGRS